MMVLVIGKLLGIVGRDDMLGDGYVELVDGAS